MKMVWFELRGFRRFEDAELNVDAPVVALVGPNESGKTSLLEALTHLGEPSNQTFHPRSLTRDLDVNGWVLKATYRLDDDDRAALARQAPRAPEIRWFRVWREADGRLSHDTVPSLASMAHTEDTTDLLAKVVQLIQKPLPEVVLSVLKDRVPRVLEFSTSDRTLQSEYDLQAPATWTGGLRNLARLARFDLNELGLRASGRRPELYEDMVDRANTRLANELSARWSQARVTVRLSVAPPNQLRILAKSEEGSLYRIEDRSDGLRAFVALVAFLTGAGTEVPPILVVDEADSHLHWDAQADLVNLFHTQEVASQIIYATHSPGCLPHDLGHGVRAVVLSSSHSDRSTVKNWIWKDKAGLRPLLLDMGASTAAVTPRRYAVVTEGVADFILLPSLLREATATPSLPYQIVPGLAQLARGGIQRIDSEADRVVYLTDGDEAGTRIRHEVRSAGIPKERTLSLPAGTVLEDLIASDTLEAAVHEEISRSGNTPSEPIEFPDSGRAAYLDDWYACNGIKPPSKRAIASRALEIAAGLPAQTGRPLLENRHRTALRNLHEELLNTLHVSSGKSVGHAGREPQPSLSTSQ